MSEPMRINSELLTSFYEQNPNFDILNFDFYDQEAISKLNLLEGDHLNRGEPISEAKTN